MQTLLFWLSEVSYGFMSWPGGRLPIYISVESIPPWRVMWTGHGIETSIPTTRKDHSAHHTRPPMHNNRRWFSAIGLSFWSKVDGLMFCTLFILLKPSKGFILLLNHSESLLGKTEATFQPNWLCPKNEKSRSYIERWSIVATLCHTNSALFCSRPKLISL